MKLDLKRNNNESYEEYGARLHRQYKLKNISSEYMRDLLNDAFDMNLGESAHRKRFERYNEGFDKGYKTALEEVSDSVEYENITAPKSHLEKLGEIVDQYDVKRRVAQVQVNELRKLKREIAPVIALSEDMKQYWLDNNFTVSVPDYMGMPLEVTNDNVMIITIADWHIGYVIDDCKGNYFNYDIAKIRVDKLIAEAKKTITLYDIQNTIVVGLGDFLEHNYLRKNQSQFCEFGLMEQINKAQDLIYYFLCSLCEDSYVDYYSLAGNHDRASGDKGQSFKGDNANVVINKNILSYSKMDDKASRLTVHEYNNFDDEIILEINGKCHKFLHGDDKKMANKVSFLKNEMSMDNMNYTLWHGHLHNHYVLSENNGRKIIGCGCLSGYNDYSRNFGCQTNASQNIAVIDENGEFELIKDVQLQIV